MSKRKSGGHKSTNPFEGRFIYMLRTSRDPVVLVGPTMAERTSDPVRARAWRSEADAQREARPLQADVVGLQLRGVLSEARWNLAQAGDDAAGPAPTVSLSLVPASSRVSGTVPRVAAPRLMTADVRSLLDATRLPFRSLGKPQYGDPKGVRLVLPGTDVCGSVWLYNLPERRDIPGWLAEDERPGRVTHHAHVTSLEGLMPLIEAVCLANGVKAPRLPNPKARRRTKTPADGTPPVSDGAPAPLSEAGDGRAMEPPHPTIGPVEGTPGTSE